MSTRTAPTPAATVSSSRALPAPTVVPFAHPQGCRSYLVADGAARRALAIDPHLDLVDELEQRLRSEGWTLDYVLDTHTHADHPSGSAALAARFGSVRVAHALAHHRGVALHPEDGQELDLGALRARVLHAPGHTPDHLVVVVGNELFTGDTLLIGGVARTDFLGGDAGTLFDTLQRLLAELGDETVVHPGHDYAGRTESTLGAERRDNPWLALRERTAFVRALTANPPPRPTNMDDLLGLNREGHPIPAALPAAELVGALAGEGATRVVDVRTGSSSRASACVARARSRCTSSCTAPTRCAPRRPRACSCAAPVRAPRRRGAPSSAWAWAA
ncbi:MAG TPA: MBL fold metallo-hydrolase [Planctomycetota bacterium]